MGWSRRPVAVAAATSMLTLVMAACGGGGDSGGGDKQLTFVSWGGGYQEAQESLIVKPWGDKNGVRVLSDGPTDYAKLKAQVDSGNTQWDVITLEPFWAISHCGTMLEKIKDKVDTSKLPAEAVSDCGIPFDILSYVLVYDSSKFGGDPPTSWADFFDTAKYPGKRGVWNYAPGGALEAALLADGVALGDLYPLDVDRALKKLDTIRGDIAYYDTGAQQVQQLQSKEVVMSIAWSGRGLDAVRAGAPYEPVWKDNLMLVDSLAILKGSKHVDEGVSLINELTSAPAQEAFIEKYTYGTVNSDAKPKLDETARKFSPTEAGHGEQGRFMDQQWWADNFDKVSGEWTKWASG
ncbi:ABC transporter substrate-binding protein [Sphaerimonospora mesophila]|uniref:ABC transporter substrate-binding protein n=1 Tax=Sphaerimonospora mesophila TaxID=37483 RepID=UPI0007C75A0A